METILNNNCYKCNLLFVKLDVPIKCDGCKMSAHNKCLSLTESELISLALKNRSLKYFCDTCNNSLCDISELKHLISLLLADVNELKTSISNFSSRSERFIINEISAYNSRTSNSIVYNSNNSKDEIAHDSNEVRNFIYITTF